MLDKYKVTLDAAQGDREDLLKRQAELFDERELIESQLEEAANQLKELDDTIASLARLCKVEVMPNLARARLSSVAMARHTLTEAIRAIFQIDTGPLTAMSMRDKMLERGFDATEYSNLLASVHTTLKRLSQPGGELEAVNFNGKTAYIKNPQYIPRIGLMGPRAQALHEALVERIVRAKK